MAFSEDEKSFAAVTQEDGKSPVVELWDSTTWKSRIRIPYPNSGDRPAEIRALALSPDGKTLVTGGGDKTLRWWDTTTGKETRKIGPGWVYYNKAAFRSDGKVLMTVSHENHVRLWDVETGKEKAITSGPGWVITSATFTPDGKRVYSVSEHTVYAHDAATGRELWRGPEHTDSAVQVVVTPDGKMVITSSHDGTLIFREAESGKVIRKIENPRHSADMLTLSPDGRTVYALGSEAPHDGVILGWDVDTGKASGQASLPLKPERYAASSIRYSPDGSGIAIASGTELRVPVFDPIRKELRTSFGPTDGGVSCAEYSADGRMLAAGTLGDSIYVWETATGQTRSLWKDLGRTTCLAFSPDGRILAVVGSGRQRIQVKGKVEEKPQDPTAIRLLDTYTGRELHRFVGHTGSVYRLAWTADGKRLLSGSHDSSCLIWDVAAVRSKLPSAAITADEAAKAVEQLNVPSGKDAFRAMEKLTGSPATAIPALRGLLRPVPTPDANRVAELIRDLDSLQFARRDRAAAELARMGEGVEGLLKNALDGKLSTEARDRIEKVLGELKPPSHRLRVGRALEVLQQIGDAEARKLLTELAAGAEGAWLTREAKAALARSIQ
jgi:WD40 repeat protein